MLVLRSVGKFFASSVLFLFFMLFHHLNLETLGIGILGIDFRPAFFRHVHVIKGLALKDFDSVNFLQRNPSLLVFLFSLGFGISDLHRCLRTSMIVAFSNEGRD